MLQKDITVLQKDAIMLRRDITIVQKDATMLQKDATMLQKDILVLREDVTEECCNVAKGYYNGKLLDLGFQVGGNAPWIAYKVD